MARNGSGTYVPPVGNPVAVGTIISAPWANTTVKDLGDEITNSLPRDGQAPMLNALKLTSGTAATPSLTFNNDVISGLYLKQTGVVGLAATATEVATFSLSSAEIKVPLTVTGDMTVSGNVVGNVTGNVSGTASNITGIVAIANGGTGATTAANALTNLGAAATASKDASGGYPGLTAYKINFKNAANTFTSLLNNTNTAARTYTFQDRNGTIADDTDLALKVNNSLIGAANGITPLDATSKIPAAYLPSLGTTDTVAEGTTNKYYTDTRARAAISASGLISYNSATGAISTTLTNLNQLTNGPGYITASSAPVQSVAGKTGAVVLVGTDISAPRSDSTKDLETCKEMRWKNYGSSHTIFDASASTAPNGTAISNTNPAQAWAATYPTLMGWNGTSTYGVRVDSARLADGISGGITPSMMGMLSSLAASGYLKLANGFIIAWGSVSATLTANTGLTGTDFSLPITFPTAIVHMGVTGQASAGGNIPHVPRGFNPSLSTGRVSWHCMNNGTSGGAITAHYFVIGY